MKTILVCLSVFLSSAVALSAGPLTPTGQHENYVSLIVGSRHLGATTEAAAELNDNTPGLTVGRRYHLEVDGMEALVEGGVFYNSYEETSPILLVGLSARAIDLPIGEIRLSAFTGIGYYKKLGEDLHEEYGLPYYKGYIPLAGLVASYRTGKHELRVTTVPAENLDAILNFSYAYAF